MHLQKRKKNVALGNDHHKMHVRSTDTRRLSNFDEKKYIKPSESEPRS